MKKQQTEKDKYIKDLKKLVEKGGTIYCVLRRVAKSGMSRDISFFVINKQRLRMIDGCIKQILGLKYSKNDGLRIHGCGMDMGFLVVHELSLALFKDGDALNYQWL
jgi:hypothetical protein